MFLLSLLYARLSWVRWFSGCAFPVESDGGKLARIWGFSRFSTFGQHSGNSWIFTNHLGATLTGFLSGAVTPANMANPATGWYVWFVQHLAIPGAGVFTYLVTFGKILVGLGLIFGVLTGIAAFFGLFMNLNFMMAGAISINPIIATQRRSGPLSFCMPR